MEYVCQLNYHSNNRIYVVLMKCGPGLVGLHSAELSHVVGECQCLLGSSCCKQKIVDPASRCTGRNP